jgi:UDP-N-acetyl-D-glucosamine/UDP-N-acetyl-D-galactosamine dehydrogenase
MIKELQSKKKLISVTGLGYVGLPLALEFARHYKVIGFDINPARVALMQKSIDPSKELETSAFDGCDIEFTTNPEDLKKAHFHIIGVPTDIDEHKVPNLRPLLGASKSVGKAIKKGDIVVYESTVYPGCTEEDCLPIIEQESGLKAGIDFQYGYSPERINPGDKERTLTKILKIVSGSNEETLDTIAEVYGSIITAGIYKASSVRVAEAAKVIENTQRDINIALMNELAMIFDKMNIDTLEVLKAAGTKWNFLKFFPGLVGGHCIGVDPYYLTYKAQNLGHSPQMILSGRKTNEEVPGFVAKRLAQYLIKAGKNPGDCKVLVMGLTFKENVADIRNTKVIEVIKELEAYSINVDLIDYWADAGETIHEYSIKLCNEPANDYDAVIVAVAHDQYKALSTEYFMSIQKDKPILFDLKGIYSDDPRIEYWRL